MIETRTQEHLLDNSICFVAFSLTLFLFVYFAFVCFLCLSPFFFIMLWIINRMLESLPNLVNTLGTSLGFVIKKNWKVYRSRTSLFRVFLDCTDRTQPSFFSCGIHTHWHSFATYFFLLQHGSDGSNGSQF